MKQFPAPGEESITMADLKAKRAEQTGERPSDIAYEETDRKAEAERVRFRKEHPGLYEEPQPIGQAIMINGETLENPQHQKKARTARRYRFFRWMRSYGWLIVVAVVVAVLFLPFPTYVHQEHQGYLLEEDGAVPRTLEIRGVMWRFLLAGDRFTGTVQSDTYSAHIRMQLGDGNAVNLFEDRYNLQISSSQVDDPTGEFHAYWEQYHMNFRGNFDLIILEAPHGKAVFPAKSAEEARQIVKAREIEW